MQHLFNFSSTKPNEFIHFFFANDVKALQKYYQNYLINADGHYTYSKFT